jgi:uncharacterized repeat protein (TIGR03803 family)
VWDPKRPKEGEQPSGGVIGYARDSLYGTTTLGGEQQCGTVFRLRHLPSEWRHEVLHSFAGGKGDGCQPSATLTGYYQTYYGNTLTGGANNNGTVFKIVTTNHEAPDQAVETVIWSFTSAVDGAMPSSQIVERDGNLYGTTSQGGPGGQGTVWELTPPAQKRGKWTMTVL